MRITGGIFSRLLVNVPKGDLRPTQDMVREALFSILGDRMTGARFLDLFAGSGAVGLEAVSRGAQSVCWVESDRRNLAVIKENADRIFGKDGCRADGVMMQFCGGDAVTFLQKGLESRPFDLIFADPPYDRDGGSGWLSRILDGLERGNALAPGGLFIMEQSAGEAVKELPSWDLVKDRKYGGTRLRFFVRKETGDCAK